MATAPARVAGRMILHAVALLELQRAGAVDRRFEHIRGQ